MEIELKGKVIISGKIEAKTGLHIGGSSTGLEIGGTENIVIRDTITRTPYIPGSSLKGKMRSLLEKERGLATDDNRVWVKKDEVSIHMCNEVSCPVCEVFGRNNGKQTKVEGSEIEITNTTPTRLIVRDSALTEECKKELEDAETDLPYTEVKFENVIDRITSAANPRQTERVPAGAEFSFEMIYNVFNQTDVEYLKYVFEAMKLLEDDYLGGQGTRGYGKIEFKDIKIIWRPKLFYEGVSQEIQIPVEHITPVRIIQNFEKIKSGIQISN